MKYKEVDGKYQCPHCGQLRKKKGIHYHVWKMHTDEGRKFVSNRTGTSWCKGLTKNEHPSLKSASEKLKGRTHPGTPHTIESKEKISKALKLAHAEGRAWNIGKSRWNNKPSHPEIVFRKFLENIGLKKDEDFYIEFPFGIYSADFYFPKIALVIEIDGGQHERFLEVKVRDRKKDDVITKQFSVEVFRISWRALFHDTKNLFRKIKKVLENRKERLPLIDEFSKTQLRILDKLEEREKQQLKEKQEKERIIRKERQRIIEQRLNDLQNIEFDLGFVSELSKKWEVTHTQVRRFIIKHFPEYNLRIRKNS